MTCFTLCQTCGVPIPDGESAHQAHDIYTCERALTGVCRCDGWVCRSCCPEQECTRLVEALQVAREDTRARAAVAEAAYGEAS